MLALLLENTIRSASAALPRRREPLHHKRLTAGCMQYHPRSTPEFSNMSVYAGAELYKEVKRATDSSLGIPSQCFVANKAGIPAWDAEQTPGPVLCQVRLFAPARIADVPLQL